jgi:hypothetical protein
MAGITFLFDEGRLRKTHIASYYFWVQASRLLKVSGCGRLVDWRAFPSPRALKSSTPAADAWVFAEWCAAALLPVG